MSNTVRRLAAVAAGLLVGATAGCLLAIKAPMAASFEGYLFRPSCADTVARQVATDKTVKGSFECLSGLISLEAGQLGIASDADLANAIGQPGASEFYRGMTGDGAYVYEVDDQMGQAILISIYTDDSGKVLAIR